MDFRALVQAMTPATYEKMAAAAATGRWADGQPMTEQQHEQAIQLVLAYQSQVLKSNEPFTIGADGQMVIRSKAELKAEIAQGSSIARFSHNDL